VFAAQDAAERLDDYELRRRLALARDWLEAADRRADDLLGDR
jgi:hypothetical protein